jgi:P27 family predicted phage terminase small subunit
LNEREPLPTIGRPKRPKFLTGLARKEWNSIVPQLVATGVIAETEGKLLAGYCQAYKRWVEAEAEIDRHGLMIVVEEKDDSGNFHVLSSSKNPACTIADAMMKQMRAFAVEFGLSAASRTKVNAKPVKREAESIGESYFEADLALASSRAN